MMEKQKNKANIINVHTRQREQKHRNESKRKYYFEDATIVLYGHIPYKSFRNYSGTVEEKKNLFKLGLSSQRLNKWLFCFVGGLQRIEIGRLKNCIIFNDKMTKMQSLFKINRYKSSDRY